MDRTEREREEKRGDKRNKRQRMMERDVKLLTWTGQRDRMKTARGREKDKEGMGKRGIETQRDRKVGERVHKKVKSYIKSAFLVHLHSCPFVLYCNNCSRSYFYHELWLRVRRSEFLVS